MSAPRTKRPFAGAASDPAQRQITSFFSPSSSGSPTATQSTKTPLNGPILPAPVQTNLLNVGMRVRKSVQEGYKTGAQYSAFKLWEDNAAPITPTPTVPVRTAGGGGMRELLPFSGIHKVGGLGIQPSNGAGADDCEMAGSQESVYSNGSATSAVEATERVNLNAKKRFFVGEEDEEEQEEGMVLSWEDVDVSPRSFGPAGFENRRWAVPRGKKGREGAVAAAAGQENTVRVLVDGNDFEEASFLEGMGDE